MRLWMARVLVAAAVCVFLGTAFRAGWTQLATDFPNYYTAAVAARERKPLREFYDWTWFARQMNYAGVENQIGAWTPQTPVTMLPAAVIAGLAPLRAKRVWLVFNVGLLAATLWMLARVTGVRWEYLAMLVLAGHRSLAANFLYGQYYVFLLFLITVTYYWLDGKREVAGGAVAGAAFALKLYTGPICLYFAARREWRAAAGMLAGAAALGFAAVAWFGWGDTAWYLTHVLPRTLEGGSIDPYHPGVPAISTLLRRTLMAEPGLNPHPPADAPWLFFFARTAAQAGLVVFTVLGIGSRKPAEGRRDFAWFVIMLVLLSTSTASYTFVLLLTPVALLLPGASKWETVYLAASYVLLSASLGAERLFPKVWLLLLLYAFAGSRYWRWMPKRHAVWAAAAVLSVAAVDAGLHLSAYRQEPGRRYPQMAVGPQALYAGHPVITRWGLFYQAMGDTRNGEPGYVLGWRHEDGGIERLAFDGYALRPEGPDRQGGVWFELVAHGRSTSMRFDPATRTAAAVPAAGLPREDRVVSPDGRWVAYPRETLWGQQLWVEERATGKREMLGGGKCNSSSPAWEADSGALVFDSDCGRAFGLPALYRAAIDF